MDSSSGLRLGDAEAIRREILDAVAASPEVKIKAQVPFFFKSAPGGSLPMRPTPRVDTGHRKPYA